MGLALGLILFLLGGTYLAALFGLPALARKAYQSQDCAKSIQYVDMYIKLGGNPAANPTGSLKTECRVYLQAQNLETLKNWQAAYDGFQTYLRDYPNGVMASNAAGQSFTALTSLAQEQIGQKNFAAAIQILQDSAASSNTKPQNEIVLDLIA